MRKSKKAFPCFHRAQEGDQLLLTLSSGNTVPVTTNNAVWILQYLQPFLQGPIEDRSAAAGELFQFHFQSQALRGQQPEPATNVWVATLSFLPTGENAPACQTCFKSSPARSKQEAKKDVALQMCHALQRSNLPRQPPSSETPNNAEILVTQPARLKVGDSSRVTARTSDGCNQHNPQVLGPPQKQPCPADLPELIPEASQERLALSLPPSRAQSVSSLGSSGDLPEAVGLSSPSPFGLLPSPYLIAGCQSPCKVIYLHRLSFRLPPPESQTSSIGLIFGRSLSTPGYKLPIERTINDIQISCTLEQVCALDWPKQDYRIRFERLDDFTRLVTQLVVNPQRHEGRLDCLLAPLREDGTIDWNLVKCPLTFFNSSVSGLSLDLLIFARSIMSRSRIFTNLRQATDILHDSKVSEIVQKYPTLANFFTPHLSTSTTIRDFFSATLGTPIDEHSKLPFLRLDAVFDVKNGVLQAFQNESGAPERSEVLLPHPALELIHLPLSLLRLVAYLPLLLRAIRDQIYAIQALAACETSIPTSLVIEALTPAEVGISPHNQILETIGGSFLKLASSVHAYNIHPLQTSCELNVLLSRATDNVVLRRCFYQSGLASYVLSDEFKMTDGFISSPAEPDGFLRDGLVIRRQTPKKVFSSAAKAFLGAAYVSGGIRSALKLASQLGVSVGGATPWDEREVLSVVQIAQKIRMDPLVDFQNVIGYRFNNLSLLAQAVTHRSATKAPRSCHERDEWLGGALLDLWVLDRLYHRVPSLNSAELMLMRASLVSNGSLGFVSLRKLSLQSIVAHQITNFNNQMGNALEELGKFDTMASFFRDLNTAFVVSDLPDLLAEVFKAIIGAIFVDSGCQIALAYQVLDAIFLEALEVIQGKSGSKPTLPPVSCTEKTSPMNELHIGRPNREQNDSVTITGKSCTSVTPSLESEAESKRSEPAGQPQNDRLGLETGESLAREELCHDQPSTALKCTNERNVQGCSELVEGNFEGNERPSQVVKVKNEVSEATQVSPQSAVVFPLKRSLSDLRDTFDNTIPPRKTRIINRPT